MIFAVLDPSPLTVCINCSFYIYVTDIVHQLINEQFNLKYIYVYNIILQ